MSEAKNIKFNIYNPIITYEHRAAYDMIVSHLQEIFPICNQGKCKALEVSDDPQKQKQINDLMEKVEFFSNSLITITKVFFDQLYRAKQTSSQSISQSTAMIKIDMIERGIYWREHVMFDGGHWKKHFGNASLYQINPKALLKRNRTVQIVRHLQRKRLNLPVLVWKTFVTPTLCTAIW